MSDLIAAIMIVTGAVCLLAAATLVGALLALIAPEHQNPIAHRWITWHSHHSHQPTRH